MIEACGTPAYMAPEVVEVGEQSKEMVKLTLASKKPKANIREINLRIAEIKQNRKTYSKKCDIWSAGVVMYAMLYGQLPFKGITTREIKDRILNHDILFADTVSSKASDLMKKMLDKNPHTRININEILAHPWFADMSDSDNYRVFNKAERVQMIKEYFVAEDEMHWRITENVKMNEVEKIELHDDYTVANLNSTATGELTNHSTKSLILAPNNSTLTEGDEQEEESLETRARREGMWVEDRHDVFTWDKKAKLADARYEREHNVNVDNGVIKEDADET